MSPGRSRSRSCDISVRVSTPPMWHITFGTRTRSLARHGGQGGRRCHPLVCKRDAFHERKQIVDLATKHRLPSMSNVREFAELGGLIAYGASLTDLQRRSATYVEVIE